jgi:hypothetical protein
MQGKVACNLLFFLNVQMPCNKRKKSNGSGKLLVELDNDALNKTCRFLYKAFYIFYRIISYMYP